MSLTDSATTGHSVLLRFPVPDWEWSFTPDFGVCVRVVGAPNAFHRFMQRWLLGIHWRRL